MISEGVSLALWVCAVLWGTVVIGIAFLAGRFLRLQREVADLTEMVLETAEHGRRALRQLLERQGYDDLRTSRGSVGTPNPSFEPSGTPQEILRTLQQINQSPTSRGEEFEERTRPTAWERISADDEDGV